MSASECDVILDRIPEKERFSSNADILALYRCLCNLSQEKHADRTNRIKESRQLNEDSPVIYERVTYSHKQKEVMGAILEHYFPDDKSKRAGAKFLTAIPGYERITASILRKWFHRPGSVYLLPTPKNKRADGTAKSKQELSYSENSRLIYHSIILNAIDADYFASIVHLKDLFPDSFSEEYDIFRPQSTERVLNKRKSSELQ